MTDDTIIEREGLQQVKPISQNMVLQQGYMVVPSCVGSRIT
jgi:hypothetical protein